jgi:hypothetical protein
VAGLGIQEARKLTMGLRPWRNETDNPDREQTKEELVYLEDWEEPNTFDAVTGTNWRPGTIN